MFGFDRFDSIARLLNERPASFLLSAVSGFVDTAGFIALYGLFTAHVTGNLVLAGAAIVQAQANGIVSRLAMLPVFVFAVAVASLLARFCRQHDRSILTVLLGCEAIALTVFMVAGVAFAPILRSGYQESAVITVGAAGVLAMGIQNALMREVLVSAVPTTMMTGNITQLTIDAVQIFLPGKQSSEADVSKAKTRLLRIVPALLGFVVGAALGAYGIAHLSFWCILLPIAVVAVMAIASTQAVKLKSN